MEKIKIIIIDDEIEYINALEQGLEMLGYNVLTASNGIEAIEKIEKENPKVILCDYKLGDIDGTHIIKKTNNKERIYIMITAYYDENVENRFKSLGAHYVIFKPINILDIHKKIKTLL